MSDQCKHCDCKGNFEKCMIEDCIVHDYWLTKELIGQCQVLSAGACTERSGVIAGDGGDPLCPLLHGKDKTIPPLARIDKITAEKIERMEAALIKLRDCDWIVTLPDRMDGVRKIAREGLG